MRKRKQFTRPKFNLLGIGVVYVMWFFPRFWVVKIGYTGTTKGVKKRASSVSKAAPGIALPVGAMIVPFAWHIEQAMHGLFTGLRWNFYKGDGHTETFCFPAHIAFVVVWYGMYLNWLAFKFVAAFVLNY